MAIMGVMGAKDYQSHPLLALILRTEFALFLYIPTMVSYLHSGQHGVLTA